MKTKTIITIIATAACAVWTCVFSNSITSGNPTAFFQNMSNAYIWHSISIFVCASVILIMTQYLFLLRKKEGEKIVPTPQQPEPPTPITYDAIVSITVINNKTDKETVFVSGNNFGLCWKFHTIESQPFKVLQIKQHRSLDRTNDKALVLATLVDYSIICNTTQTFPIAPTEPSNIKQTQFQFSSEVK